MDSAPVATTVFVELSSWRSFSPVLNPEMSPVPMDTEVLDVVVANVSQSAFEELRACSRYVPAGCCAQVRVTVPQEPVHDIATASGGSLHRRYGVVVPPR